MKYFLMAFSGILMFGCILVGLDRYPEISLVIKDGRENPRSKTVGVRQTANICHWLCFILFKR